MKILQITSWDSIGQQFNGYQIHQALLERGEESHMAVHKAEFSHSSIHQIGNRFTRKLDRYLSAIERRLSLHAFLPFVSASTLYFSDYYQQADLIHLQLIHAESFFSLFNLPLMSGQKKTIWTLHDPWMLAGHCIHSLDCDRWLTGCGNCPDLKSPFPIQKDTTALTWKLKHWIMHHSQIILVVASQWMYNRVKKSPILSHLPCHIIPLGSNLKQFQPRDQNTSRLRFGIPPEAQVLAFRYRGESESYKGGYWLKQALAMLKVDKPTYLITFDTYGGLESFKDKYKIIELGWVSEQDLLVDALNAADIFLMPSVAESFGMMAVEAMACATPVIVFEGTALTNVIKNSGVSVPYKDSQALSQAIEKLLQDIKLRQKLAQKGLKLVREEYDSELYIQRHLDLYTNLLNN